MTHSRHRGSDDCAGLAAATVAVDAADPRHVVAGAPAGNLAAELELSADVFADLDRIGSV
jgi:hypothetical protein